LKKEFHHAPAIPICTHRFHRPELLPDESNRSAKVPEAAVAASAKLAAMVNETARLGFMFFLTGEKTYAGTAYEILDLAGQVPRWGWYNRTTCCRSRRRRRLWSDEFSHARLARGSSSA
jgi:hypothetical protein